MAWFPFASYLFFGSTDRRRTFPNSRAILELKASLFHSPWRHEQTLELLCSLNWSLLWGAEHENSHSFAHYQSNITSVMRQSIVSDENHAWPDDATKGNVANVVPLVPVKIKSELRNLPTTVRSKHVDWLTPQLRGCLACSSGDAHRASLSVSKLPKRDADVTKTCSAESADGIGQISQFWFSPFWIFLSHLCFPRAYIFFILLPKWLLHLT